MRRLLATSQSPDHMVELDRRIGHALDDLSAMHEALARLGRFVAAGPRPDVGGVPLADLLAPLGESLSAAAAARGLRLEMPADSIILPGGDRDWLAQILGGLLQFAIDQADRGAVALEAESLGAGGALTVRFHAPGLSARAADRAFVEPTGAGQEGAPRTIVPGPAYFQQAWGVLGGTLAFEERGEERIFRLVMPRPSDRLRPPRPG